MRLKFDERRDIINFIESSDKIVASDLYKAIWYSALYFTKIDAQNNVFDVIVEYISARCAEFHYESYTKQIEKSINKAKNYVIKHVNSITFTQSEMDYIATFNNLRKEKLVFVMIAMAKYFNALSGNDKNLIYMTAFDIFKMARVSVAAKERSEFLGFAFDCGLMDIPYSFGNNMYVVRSPEADGETVLELYEDDFLELGFAYVQFRQGGYKKCKCCGRWFKTNKNKKRLEYCSLHRKKKDELLFKEVNCVDCGNVFFVLKRNQRTCRCADCQNENRKKAKKDWYYKNLDSMKKY